MLGQRAVGRMLQEPGARGLRVHHRFGGGKGLGGDDEQRRLGIDLAQGGVHVVTVDVRDEVHRQARVGILAQGQADHLGPEVGAANADVDNVGDRLAAVAQPGAGAHRVGKGAHPIEHGVHVGVDVLAIDHQFLAARGAQCGVQHGATFGQVDALAGEHGVAPGFHPALTRQVGQQFERARVQAVLGIIEEQAGGIHRHFREALRVGRKQAAHLPVFRFDGVGFQGLVAGGGREGRLVHVRIAWSMGLSNSTGLFCKFTTNARGALPLPSTGAARGWRTCACGLICKIPLKSASWIIKRWGLLKLCSKISEIH